MTTLNHTLEPRWAPIVVRLATAADHRALERLAQLDSTSAPAGQTVIAELDGRPVVAVSIADGSTIADPFIPTSEISELVRLRAQQLGLFAHSVQAARPRRLSKASPYGSKASGREIHSFLPMFRRLSQLILRTA